MLLMDPLVSLDYVKENIGEPGLHVTFGGDDPTVNNSIMVLNYAFFSSYCYLLLCSFI